MQALPPIVALLGNVVFYNKHGVDIHCRLAVVGLLEAPSLRGHDP